MMEPLQYKLDRFEGPLDLLLNLVEKNKINIDDIPISLLCNQYMEYISAAQTMDMELSSEFIVMASELMLIKSKMLLPRNEELEEDPRAALAAAMLEYQRIKQTTTEMKRMFEIYGSRMTKETDEIPTDHAFVADHSVELLARAMRRLLSEISVSDTEILQRFDPLLQKPSMSVAEASAHLVESIQKHGFVTLKTYFSSADSRSTMIAMFMAILELLKSGILLLTEEEYHSDGIVYSSQNVQLTIRRDADLTSIPEILKESANA